jgi:hypothetical protein
MLHKEDMLALCRKVPNVEKEVGWGKWGVCNGNRDKHGIVHCTTMGCRYSHHMLANKEGKSYCVFTNGKPILERDGSVPSWETAQARGWKEHTGWLFNNQSREILPVTAAAAASGVGGGRGGTSGHVSNNGSNSSSNAASASTAMTGYGRK